MSKGTEFGKRYAEALKSSPSKSVADRKARSIAHTAFKEAQKKYDEDKPARLKKLKEEKEELLKTSEERIKTKKEKRLAKNKARKEKQAKAKEASKPVEEKISAPESVPSEAATVPMPNESQTKDV